MSDSQYVKDILYIKISLSHTITLLAHPFDYHRSVTTFSSIVKGGCYLFGYTYVPIYEKSFRLDSNLLLWFCGGDDRSNTGVVIYTHNTKIS